VCKGRAADYSGSQEHGGTSTLQQDQTFPDLDPNNHRKLCD